jgi:hypothetical protein
MPTLYLSPRYSDDSQILWRAAIDSDWDALRLSWYLMDHLAPSEVKGRVVYGETSFARWAAEKLRVELVDVPEDYLTNLPKKFLNRAVDGWELGEYLDFVETAMYTGIPVFVKPVEKGPFEAKVYSDPINELKNVDKFTKILTAEPVKWKVEFRTFVVGGKVKTIAPYSRYGELVETANMTETFEAYEFAKEVVEDSFGGLGGAAFVLDVGKIEGRDWSVVEANPAWGSGLYGCDEKEALRVIEKASKEITW